MKKNKSKRKTALITGITGQDGSYLAELLLDKNYNVYGIKRRSSSINTERIDDIYQDPNDYNTKLKLVYGDLTDSLSVIDIINKIQPDEIYNLGAQSHVKVSFEIPEYTSNVVALGALRILEAIRILKLENKTKYYQASSSELFGKTKDFRQSEKTNFYPRSPYAVSKLFAYWITINYREAYGIFACNGILFNHESPRRGETFVTKKITTALVKIKFGLQKTLYIGNLYSKRDWGHAKDFVFMQWKMLQQKNPQDYVISTGKQYTVKDFIEYACREINLKIKWQGSGINEHAIDIDNNKVIIKVNKKYFRPTEVDHLLGNSTKANKELNWKPKISFKNLVKDMVEHDLKKYAKKNK